MRKRREREARQADEFLLTTRLQEMGLRSPVEVHENRSVLVSVGKHGTLRVHRGFAYASDSVLTSILAFVSPHTRRGGARAARRRVVEFPVHEYVGGRRARRPGPAAAPEDRPDVKRLKDLFCELNEKHFDGLLPSTPIRISRRMRTRLGEVTISPEGQPTELAIGRYHIDHDGWDEVRHTLLHEMVHLWQAANGKPVDHGSAFRRKARELGIQPSATRDLDLHRNSH